MAKTTAATPKEAKDNADAVLALWKMGRDSRKHLDQLRRADPHALDYGRREDTYRAEAGRLGTNVDTAAKVRRLAREYTYAQVRELQSLIRRHRSRFGPANLLVLLRVGDRARRDELMRQAVEGSWTTARLERAVQAARGGRREHVGRRPRVPDDPAEALVALDALCEKWARWCDAAAPNLPSGLHAMIKRATRAVRAVQRAGADELENLLGDGKKPAP